ncbi:hypothetical protein [Teichococcus oryzae]|uniref:Amidase domain-containing protein n=1 Tax=Teichococcus oryzae TaxID=1608942 RepID=A0A5B2T9J9_9PROT|nr:hypothetical protein [Pseudoroseomonas oryzae]KAA2211292.1 hypothetical protein F0Q34_20870 [Pseudoroseomonas oryzae]
MSPEESCPLFDTAGVTYAISIMGHHPAICISCGLDEYGMPFGLQVIGLRSANSLMLDAAMALEKLFRDLPGFGRPLPDLTRLEAVSREVTLPCPMPAAP